MAIQISATQYFSGSGAISFSAMRNTFRLNNPTGTISASELLRNTDVTNTDPILPDATENSDVATSTNWKTSQIRDSIKFYNLTQPSSDTNVNLDIDGLSWNSNLNKNVVKKMFIQGTCGSNTTSTAAALMDSTAHNLTIDVSGDIFGCGALAVTDANNPDGFDGGDALDVITSGNNVSVNVQSTARIYGGCGGGEHGNDGVTGQDGTCFNYIFGEVASGCGFCGDCSNLGAGYENYGGCNSGGGCNCAGWWFWYGCRQTTLSTALCRKQDPITVTGGTGGAGGDGGRGRGFNYQSGTLSGSTGAGGGSFVGCGGFTGTITAGGTGGDGETGGTGGDWGENGANTDDTGDGGTAGKAIDRSTNVSISGIINSNTVKGTY